MRIRTSDICTAFDDAPIGTKVIGVDFSRFFRAAETAIDAFDFTKCRVPGQGLIACPEAVPFISSGVGKRSIEVSDYVLRSHRGVVSAYLKRRFAAPITSCSLVVYTKQAYFDDPDVTTDEIVRINESDCTHVLVAVLSSAGVEPPPLPTHRLVWNLAGGNREALVWTADEIRQRASDAVTYDDIWSTVAG